MQVTYGWLSDGSKTGVVTPEEDGFEYLGSLNRYLFDLKNCLILLQHSPYFRMHLSYDDVRTAANGHLTSSLQTANKGTNSG